MEAMLCSGRGEDIRYSFDDVLIDTCDFGIGKTGRRRQAMIEMYPLFRVTLMG
jgi:hypothetical protein